MSSSLADVPLPELRERLFGSSRRRPPWPDLRQLVRYPEDEEEFVRCLCPETHRVLEACGTDAREYRRVFRRYSRWQQNVNALYRQPGAWRRRCDFDAERMFATTKNDDVDAVDAVDAVERTAFAGLARVVAFQMLTCPFYAFSMITGKSDSNSLRDMARQLETFLTAMGVPDGPDMSTRLNTDLFSPSSQPTAYDVASFLAASLRPRHLLLIGLQF